MASQVPCLSQNAILPGHRCAQVIRNIQCSNASSPSANHCTRDCSHRKAHSKSAIFYTHTHTHTSMLIFLNFQNLLAVFSSSKHTQCFWMNKKPFHFSLKLAKLLQTPKFYSLTKIQLSWKENGQVCDTRYQYNCPLCESVLHHNPDKCNLQYSTQYKK